MKDPAANVYRFLTITQPALINIHKHAKATAVKVNIRKLSNNLRLEIHDNGKSFDVERVLFTQRQKRLGFLGSRERVEMIGGKFRVESAPGRGTKISAEIPIVVNGTKGKPKTSRKITAEANL